MKLIVLSLSSLLLLVNGAPAVVGPKNAAPPAASPSPAGPLSAALLTSTTVKPTGGAEQQPGNEPTEDLNSRRAKMLNYFGYYPGGYYGGPAIPPSLNPQAAAAFMAPPPPPPYSQLSDFYQFPYGAIAPVYSYSGLLGGDADDSYDSDDQHQTMSNDVDSSENDYDEDVFSRANRRRPGGKGNSNRNSPIFYIRLPPTPYMFIRGLGYISNPPTIQPLPAPVPSFNFNPSPYQNPYMPANPYIPPANPFINVPVNYMSNAKPVGVYQYQGGYQQSAAAAAASASAPSRFPINAAGAMAGYGPNQVPMRQRPGNGYSNPDSKITHLKGPFIFNGRPEDIYLLQNLQTTPYNANFFHGYY